jgi:ATP-dependent exoDNAse (exonuclease V) beta subunit
LQDLLICWARRGGLFVPEDVRAAVGRVSRMLSSLQATELYAEICAAQQRHAEVPLSICAGDQVLHGMLDLLYRDRQGEWRLLDWKTEPVRKGQTLQDAASPYLRQIAVYSRGVEQLLDLRARSEICFLSEQGAVYNPTTDELGREWNALLSQA